jgi:hypothetical protein
MDSGPFLAKARRAHRIRRSLGPYDTISFPPGVPPPFENLVPTPGDTQDLLLVIAEDDAPESEAMPGVLKELADLVRGVLFARTRHHLIGNAVP